MERSSRASRRLLSASLAAALALSLLVVAPSPRVDAAEPELVGRIAYAAKVDGDYEIFVMRADGSKRRRLTTNNKDDTDPAWSPDGRRLVYERKDRTGYSDLYIFNLRTGRARPWITSRNSDEGDPEWSPNGRWIAYRGNDWGDGADVLATRIDLSVTRAISRQDYNSSNAYPTWSPDGKKIGLIESHEESSIFVAEFCCTNGYDKDLVQPPETWVWAWNLDWSPAGSCLLYSRGPSGGSLHVLEIGGTATEVYSDLGDVDAGSWSPDGRGFVFTSDAKGSRDIYVADRNGENVQTVVSSARDEIDPAWYGRGLEPEPCGVSEPQPEPSESPSPSP